MVRSEDYAGREQAYVKHFVLERYLQLLAIKVGHFRPGTSLNYIDGFSGPWQPATAELRDTSPHIALTQLRAAREDLAKAKKRLGVRGLFVENDPSAFARLRDLMQQFADVETVTLPGEFESHVPEVVEFAGRGPKAFAFVFIDPTGWTGFGLKAITPLLRVQPSEVLINFMTKDVKRFIDDPESSALPTFVDLFGDASYRDAWAGMEELDREDAIVATYCDRIKKAGGFRYVCSTIILNPQHDRTHYHLVYGTRSLVGLVTFREIERKASTEQRAVRATARQQTRVSRRGQTEMFGAAQMETSYADELEQRYRTDMERRVLDELRKRGTVPYDDLIEIALQMPMTSEHDLKELLGSWKKRGELTFEGLAQKERVPKPEHRHKIRWTGTTA